MEEPREIDIDTFQCPEELLESIEDLQYKVEELQVYCQESEKKNAELQQLLIEKERDCKKRLNVSSEELSKLRETKVRIVRENVMKECAVTPRWFNALTKSVEQEKKITELTKQVDDLNVQLMDKSKTISSLEWKVKDCEATIVVLTSDRNRLALEIDDMALRIEEFEYAENFRKKDCERSQSETASFNSYEEDAMSFSDKPSGLHSRTSFHSEEGPDNFVPLKRAANFSNINTLDELANFQVKKEDIKEDIGESLSKTPSVSTSKEENNNIVESFSEGCSKETGNVDNGEVESNSNCSSGEMPTVPDGNLSVRLKDASWEKFDRSDSSVNFSKRREVELEKNRMRTEMEKSSIFEMQNSPFTELLESTPVTKSGQTNGGVKEVKPHGTIEELGAGDPWASPSVSPVIEKKNKSLSRNLFWEKNTDCTIYPFYLPDESDEEEAQETSNAVDHLGLARELSAGKDEEIFSKLEPFKDKIDLVSPTSLPSSFSFDEKMMSFDEDDMKPAKVFVKKASKENLWDFEPDSIVDVSTGQTIYESMATGEDSDQKSKSSNNSEAGDATQRPEVSETNTKEVDPSTTQVQPENDSSAGTSSNKDKNTENENTANGDATQHEKQIIKKGSKKEREALQRYMQWKTKGKQGMPPANFKISLC